MPLKRFISGQLWPLFALFVVLEPDTLPILLMKEPVETILRSSISQIVRSNPDELCENLRF